MGKRVDCYRLSLAVVAIVSVVMLFSYMELFRSNSSLHKWTPRYGKVNRSTPFNKTVSKTWLFPGIHRETVALNESMNNIFEPIINRLLQKDGLSPEIGDEDLSNFKWRQTEPFKDSCGLLDSVRPPDGVAKVIQPDCNSSDFVVYVCGDKLCGGLGDRLRGIIAMFVLALVTNRTFVINHSKPCQLSESLVPSLYDWQHCQEYVQGLAENSTKTIRFFEREYYRQLHADKLMDFGKVMKKRAMFIQTNLDYGITWTKQQSETKHILPGLYKTGCKLYSDALRILFKPSPRLQKEIESFLSQKKGRQLVCSHIRMGKNPSNPDDSKAFNVNTSTIYRFLDRFTNNKKYVIYIASDSESIRNEVLSRYPNAVSTGRQIVHVDRFNATGDECSGLYTAVMEMQLLSKCDVLVLSRGNFGWMAARFRGTAKNLFCFANKQRAMVPCERLTF